jgi:hypothetical protein
MPKEHFDILTLLEIEVMNRPGGELRERTPVALVNGKPAYTFALFAEIVNNLRNTTVECFDADGNEYEAFHLTIDVDRNLIANSWFQI